MPKREPGRTSQFADSTDSPRSGADPARIALALAATAVLLVAAPAFAGELTGADVRLVLPTLGSASGRLTNPGTGATATAEVTLGQPGAAGDASAPVSGVQLEAGYLRAAVHVPEPGTAELRIAGLAGLAWLARRRRRRERREG